MVLVDVLVDKAEILATPFVFLELVIDFEAFLSKLSFSINRL